MRCATKPRCAIHFVGRKTISSAESDTPLNSSPAGQGALGGSNSWAYGINDAGDIVGTARTPAGSDHAFLHSAEP
jgi:probable HAF family extracellular repeat protein